MAAGALAERKKKKKTKMMTETKTKTKKTHEHNLIVSEPEKNWDKVENENKQNSSAEKKRKKEKEKKVDGKNKILHGSVVEGNVNEARGNSQKDKSSTKRKRKSRDKANAGKGNQLDATNVSSFEERNEGTKQSESQGNILEGTDIETKVKSKSEKAGRMEKKRKIFINKEEIVEKSKEPEQDEVYQFPSLNGDSSKGMKKWIMEYHQNRPGLNILQQRIDDSITAHEEQKQQEKIEREARLGEGGWTVVGHHKGRKKTTDAESGTTMGSVALTAVLDKIDKKKKKEVKQDFYRFQKREAQRSEIMKLQSKFEEDKKRIQQLRAARKFKPY